MACYQYQMMNLVRTCLELCRYFLSYILDDIFLSLFSFMVNLFCYCCSPLFDDVSFSVEIVLLYHHFVVQTVFLLYMFIFKIFQLFFMLNILPLYFISCLFQYFIQYKRLRSVLRYLCEFSTYKFNSHNESNLFTKMYFVRSFETNN